MVDISSGDKKINITVSTSGNKASVNATPDTAMYYSNKSREWATSNTIVDNEDYSSKYYANESKKQAETVKNKITEVNSAVAEGITNIINQENISVDNVNTAGATQVSLAKEQATIATTQAGIATAKASEVVESGNNAITAITEQETTSKNNIITTGNEQVERVNLTGIDNRTPIFSQSEIETNESVYKNINDLKHSTLDLSKFEVVGSPTITSDGVASGFGEDNYLTVQVPELEGATDFKIKIAYTHTKNLNTSEYQFILSDNRGTKYGLALWSDRTSNINRIKLRCKSTNFNLITNPVVGQTYYFEITPSIVKIATDGVTTSVNIDTSTMQPWSNGLWIGNRNDSDKYQAYSKGSIDLSYFSTTVDGKEVFSGNKTGLDVIKPDNYEVVGSPVISEDGIASGFSDNDYIAEIPLSLSTQNTLLFNYKGICGSLSKVQRLISFKDQSSSSVYISTLGALNVANVDYANWAILNNALSEGDIFEFTAIISTNLRYIKLHNFTTGTVRESSNTNQVEVRNLGKVQLGYFLSAGTRSLFADKIDLNAFKIYVDGNLVYQPCLKIPYTETAGKYGSKIVDSIYRDRVIDCYEQDYPQKYYTIDEENKNFTLPMGEIYGMIESKADKVNVEEQLATKTNMLQASGAGMPSSKYVDLTLGVNGSTYTAPADGWVSLDISGSGDKFCGITVKIKDTDEHSVYNAISSDALEATAVTVPIKSGYIFQIWYSNGTTARIFKFIYANGAQGGS